MCVGLIVCCIMFILCLQSQSMSCDRQFERHELGFGQFGIMSIGIGHASAMTSESGGCPLKSTSVPSRLMVKESKPLWIVFTSSCPFSVRVTSQLPAQSAAVIVLVKRFIQRFNRLVIESERAEFSDEQRPVHEMWKVGSAHGAAGTTPADSSSSRTRVSGRSRPHRAACLRPQ